MNRNTKGRKWIEVFIGIIAIVISGIVFAKLFYNSSQEKVLNTLKEISAQSVEVLNKEVESGKNILSNLAVLLGQEENPDITKILKKLIEVDDSNAFKRMGLVTPDGKAHTTDQVEMNVSERLFFQESMDGKAVMSDILEDQSDGKRINVFSAPVNFLSGERYVLFAALSIEKFQKLLSVSSFEGEGFSYVIRENGETIAGSAHENALGNGENIYDEMQRLDSANISAVEKMKQEIAEKGAGSVKFQNGQAYYIYYETLGIHDWTLLTVVPSNVVQLSINGTLFWMYAFILLCSIIIIGLTLHLFRIRTKNRKIVERIAFEDEITGGDTYAKFKMDVQECLKYKGSAGFAMVYLNVRKFQYINELFGYGEGDRTLKYIWNCIHEELQEDEYCARIQADYFCVLMQNEGRDVLEKRMDFLLNKIGDRTEFEDKHYEIHMYTGIYEIENGNIEIDTMMDRARMAMQTRDRDLLDGYVFYDDKMREERIRTKEMEDCFAEGIANHEFLVYYQPKYNVKEKKYEGAEALVRWQSPLKGMISPGEFISVFEKNGMILQLDEYVFEEVCIHIKRWLKEDREVTPISINISRIHLYEKDFIQRYLEIIQKHNVPVNLIQLELTETVMLSDEKVLRKIVDEFHSHGIWVLMDDFGSGYSSLNTLKNIPIDVLKIDKSIIDDYEQNEKGKTIISNIIFLAKQLKIAVVAEGVETKEQYDFLETVDCDYIQGFYCARPMPVGEYEKLLLKE